MAPKCAISSWAAVSPFRVAFPAISLTSVGNIGSKQLFLSANINATVAWGLRSHVSSGLRIRLGPLSGTTYGGASMASGMMSYPPVGSSAHF